VLQSAVDLDELGLVQVSIDMLSAASCRCSYVCVCVAFVLLVRQPRCISWHCSLSGFAPSA